MGTSCDQMRANFAAGSAPGRERWGPSEARRYHHYWRNPEGEWFHRELPGAVGNRPKLFMDSEDNAFMIYGTIRGYDGDLAIASAGAASLWTDWEIIHVEKGPFASEMLGDGIRWKKEGILSIMLQASPPRPHEPTPLRIMDFRIEKK